MLMKIRWAFWDLMMWIDNNLNHYQRNEGIGTRSKCFCNWVDNGFVNAYFPPAFE